MHWYGCPGMVPGINQVRLEMQTKPKANSIITHAIEGNVIAFNVKGAGSLSLNMGALHPDVLARAAIHGMIQRISDAAAIGRNPETGASATPQEKLENMAALVAHYESGTADWSRKRAGGERDTSGITLQALMRVKGLDEAAAREAVAKFAAAQGMDTAEAFRLLAKSGPVAEAILAIKAERLAATAPVVDADAALASIGG